MILMPVGIENEVENWPSDCSIDEIIIIHASIYHKKIFLTDLEKDMLSYPLAKKHVFFRMSKLAGGDDKQNKTTSLVNKK